MTGAISPTPLQKKGSAYADPRTPPGVPDAEKHDLDAVKQHVKQQENTS